MKYGLLITLLTSSLLFGENEIWKFLNTLLRMVVSVSNAPRYQDDRFEITGGLSTGHLR